MDAGLRNITDGLIRDSGHSMPYALPIEVAWVIA